MLQKIIVVSCLIAATFALHGHEEHDYHAPPHYKFEYSVHDSHTHDIKKQEETRVDDKVKGYYSLKEADGTTREVHYTSDHKNGFNAVVHRRGQAIHPQQYKSSSENFYGTGEHYTGESISSSSLSGKY